LTEILGTVSGSFNKHLSKIHKKVREFDRAGIRILSPRISTRIREKNGFVFLAADKGNARQIEQKHLEAISKSDFLFVIDPKGYVGTSVAFEIGYAVSRNIPVFSSDPPSDPILRQLISSARSLSQMRHEIRMPSKGSHSEGTLGSVQDQVRLLAMKKGFHEETLNDKIVLLTEELGELARVGRRTSGLKASKKVIRAQKPLSDELADCLIYLADIANFGHVDLEEAVKTKLANNFIRTWHTIRRPSGPANFTS
jgi:NTP pyrophosphatase (non-canonical NTP hydrolase)